MQTFHLFGVVTRKLSETNYNIFTAGNLTAIGNFLLVSINVNMILLSGHKTIA